MTSLWAHRRGTQPTSLMMWALATAMLITSMGSSKSTVVAEVSSERCYGTGNCSLHVLDCGSSQRMAVFEAAYGFRPAGTYTTCLTYNVTGDPYLCSQDCCRYSKGNDCKVGFSGDNQERVKSSCSFATSCSLRVEKDSNSFCSVMHAKSTYSVLRATCVPEAVTVHPCWNVTVTGPLVSLYHAHPLGQTSYDNTCYCLLHDTADIGGGGGDNSTSVSINSYEISAASGQWAVEVAKPGVGNLFTYSGVMSKFPARVELRTKLPLSVRFRFEDVSVTPQRVWLGFQALKREGDHSPSLTLRCGQHAVAYDRSLYPGGGGANPQAVITPAPPSRTSEEVSIPLVTSMIVLGIVLLVFAYGIVNWVRKRGWRHSFCCDLEKGNVTESRSRSNTVNSDNNTTTTANTNNKLDNNNRSKYNNQNGSVKSDNEEDDDDDDDDDERDTKTEAEPETDYKTYLSHRLSATEWKKYRTESLSSRKSSFGNLENINEDEDEPEAPKPNLAFASLIASVHERLSKLGITTSEDDEDEEDSVENSVSNGRSGSGLLNMNLGPREHKNTVNITGTMQIFLGSDRLKGNSGDGIDADVEKRAEKEIWKGSECRKETTDRREESKDSRTDKMRIKANSRDNKTVNSRDNSSDSKESAKSGSKDSANDSSKVDDHDGDNGYEETSESGENNVKKQDTSQHTTVIKSHNKRDNVANTLNDKKSTNINNSKANNVNKTNDTDKKMTSVR